MLSSLKYTGSGSVVSVLQQVVTCWSGQGLAMFTGLEELWGSSLCIEIFAVPMLGAVVMISLKRVSIAR